MREQHGEFTREISWTPAYDERSDDPTKNYGIHGLEMRWYLKGVNGVIQFIVYTSWNLPHVQEELDAKQPSERFPYTLHKPMAADIGYHAYVPQYENHTSTENCKLLEDKQCYYDGSGLHAETVFKKLITEGEEAVWAEMMSWYEDIITEKEEK